jgi:hypothetical protein
MPPSPHPRMVDARFRPFFFFFSIWHLAAMVFCVLLCVFQTTLSLGYLAHLSLLFWTNRPGTLEIVSSMSTLRSPVLSIYYVLSASSHALPSPLVASSTYTVEPGGCQIVSISGCESMA